MNNWHLLSSQNKTFVFERNFKIANIAFECTQPRATLFDTTDFYSE